MKTNRDYYSYSQLSLFLKSKREFYKRYVLGTKQIPNKYFDKGKEFAEFKETGQRPHFCDDPLLETVANAVPALKLQEEKIELEVEGFKFLLYTDSSDGVGNIFYEYKTGKVPWTQEMVDTHFQLDFYAFMIWTKYKTIPECRLYWIETEEVEINGENKLRYTGYVEHFDRKFTKDELMNTFKKCLAIILDIEEYQYLELDLDENTVERYLELLEIQKNTKKELDLIKIEVRTILESEGLDYGSTSKGRFSISKRTNWSYTQALNDKTLEYKKDIDKLKKEEQDDGKASRYYTESLLFHKVK